MKASAQYNDYVGTAAADHSDHIFLIDYLKERGVDTNRYTPIGFEFYAAVGGLFSYSFICKDNQQPNSTKAVKIEFTSDDNANDFFALFKRFNVIITNENYSNWELDDNPIMIDDRE